MCVYQHGKWALTGLIAFLDQEGKDSNIYIYIYILHLLIECEKCPVWDLGHGSWIDNSLHDLGGALSFPGFCFLAVLR